MHWCEIISHCSKYNNAWTFRLCDWSESRKEMWPYCTYLGCCFALKCNKGHNCLKLMTLEAIFDHFYLKLNPSGNADRQVSTCSIQWCKKLLLKKRSLVPLLYYTPHIFLHFFYYWSYFCEIFHINEKRNIKQYLPLKWKNYSLKHRKFHKIFEFFAYFQNYIF